MAAIDQYRQIQENIAQRKPTENQLNKANYYGYTPEQVQQEMNKLQPATPQAPAPTSMPAWWTPPAQAPAQPIQPATPQPAPEAPTWITTPQAQVEKNILSPTVTGMVSPEQAKLDQANLNKINSTISLYNTGESLYNGVKSGSILPWSKEFTALAQSKPEVIAQYNEVKQTKDNYNQVKVLGEAIVWEVQPAQKSNALEWLLAYFQKDLSTDLASEYQNNVVNNPAYQASVQKFNDINQQIADNNKNIQALSNDVRRKYSAWTPESLIASAIAREARPLLEQWQYLSNLQSNAESEMTRILEDNKQVFDLKQQDRTQKNQRMIDLYGTIRTEEIRQEDLLRADKKLEDEIARTDKADKEKIKQLEQERLDNVKEAIAKLWATPKGTTYDELLGEYATAVKNQPKEDKITTGLKPWDSYLVNGELKIVPELWGVGGTLWDLRPLASQYPNEASFKNNNPAWFTINNAFQQYFNTWVAPAGSTADIWSKAWIQFWPWANRPSGEGGKYVQFPTIDEWLRAMKLWWETRNNTIDEQLKSFSAAWYKLPWFEWKKFSELSEDQKNQFLMTQIKKESPWLSRVLSQQQAQKSDPFLQAFNVLAFDKPTLQKQEQKVLQDLISSGNEAQVKTKLENLASNNIEWAPEKTAYQQTRTLVSSLDKVRQTLDNLKSKGVNTGLLKGKYEDIANKFGKVGDPEIAKLGVTLRDQLDALRRARSWAALTEFEEKFYDSIFPSAWKSYDLNVAGLEGLLDSRKALKNSYLQNAYGDDLFNTIWWDKQTGWQSAQTNDYKWITLPWAKTPASTGWYKWYSLPN